MFLRVFGGKRWKIRCKVSMYSTRIYIRISRGKCVSAFSVSASRDRKRRRLIGSALVCGALFFFSLAHLLSFSTLFRSTLFFSSSRFSGRSRVIIGAAVCAMAGYRMWRNCGYRARAALLVGPPVPLRVASPRYIDLFSSFSRTSFSASARRVFTVEWKFARQPNIFPSSLGSVRVSLSHSSSSSSFCALLSSYNVGQFHRRVFIYGCGQIFSAGTCACVRACVRDYEGAGLSSVSREEEVEESVEK